MARKESAKEFGIPGPMTLALPAALSDEDLAFLRGLVHKETGIHLSDGKRAFIGVRLLRRLRELGFSTYAEYCAHVRAVGESEHISLFDALCIHETRFFREPAHFDFLSQVLVPRWHAAGAQHRRPIRVWSAGCSTGEEAYTLGMILRSALPARLEISVDILATDLSSAALTAARQGLYPLSRAGEIPEAYLKAFMLRGRGRWEGSMRVGPEIREMVRFERLNLHRIPYVLDSHFDAIFCRNVLIYFDTPTRARVVGALLTHLQRDGALFVGHAEGLHGANVRARPIFPSVYAPVGEDSECP